MLSNPDQATTPVEHVPIGLIVTGGIGTGKSAFVAALREEMPSLALHDADRTVHRLYGDPDVREELAAEFGASVLTGEADVDRAAIRKAVFTEPSKRARLEAILHPRVRAACQAAWNAAQAGAASLFVADIPLFFEGGQWKPDPSIRVLVVACSPRTQRDRLAARNPFDKDAIERIISSQADLAAKMAAADFVVWNEGGLQALRRQAASLVDHLIPRTKRA